MALLEPRLRVLVLRPGRPDGAGDPAPGRHPCRRHHRLDGGPARDGQRPLLRLLDHLVPRGGVVRRAHERHRRGAAGTRGRDRSGRLRRGRGGSARRGWPAGRQPALHGSRVRLPDGSGRARLHRARRLSEAVDRSSPAHDARSCLDRGVLVHALRGALSAAARALRIRESVLSAALDPLQHCLLDHRRADHPPRLAPDRARRRGQEALAEAGRTRVDPAPDTCGGEAPATPEPSSSLPATARRA